MNQSNESDEYRERQQRTRLLVGDGGLERLRNAHVLVLGVGGVGAYAAEQLARAGIGRLTLIDGDCVEPSNCNRQLPALSSTLGQPKALVMAERLRQVNPDLDVQSRIEFIRESDVPELLAGDFDYAVDAIDSLGPKIAFLLECRRRKLPLISSMGAGRQDRSGTDPARRYLQDIRLRAGAGRPFPSARTPGQPRHQSRILSGSRTEISRGVRPESGRETALHRRNHLLYAGLLRLLLRRRRPSRPSAASINPEVEAARNSNLYSATESGGFAWRPGKQDAYPLLKKLLRKTQKSRNGSPVPAFSAAPAQK